MGSPSGTAEAGWNWLDNSTREHYFQADSRSLCGKWMNLGSQRTTEPTYKPPCAVCKRRLEMLRG